MWAVFLFRPKRKGPRCSCFKAGGGGGEGKGRGKGWRGPWFRGGRKKKKRGGGGRGEPICRLIAFERGKGDGGKRNAALLCVGKRGKKRGGGGQLAVSFLCREGKGCFGKGKI